jgi:DNA-binding LacI/PurR family transcriptional regulator
MRDVAQAAGVTQGTVSRVISGSFHGVTIRPETRERVLAAVRDLGYQRNQYASFLRGKKSHMIGMLIADISNPFYHPMVRAVQDVASQHEYGVMIANSDHTREKELLFVESVIRRPVDGIVIVPYYLEDPDLEDLITRTGVSIAAVGNHIQHPHIDITFADDAAATQELVGWLINTRGHRRVAMICADMAFPVTARRLQAFREAMHKAGLDIPPEYIVSGDWTFETGMNGIRRLMDLPVRPTAVFAASDTIAIGAMEAAEDMNLRIPADVAIVGFDDIPEAQWVRPRLTTVAQYPADMGRSLANALFDRIDGDADRERRVFQVPCRLIERESA